MRRQVNDYRDHHHGGGGGGAGVGGGGGGGGRDHHPHAHQQQQPTHHNHHHNQHHNHHRRNSSSSHIYHPIQPPMFSSRGPSNRQQQPHPHAPPPLSHQSHPPYPAQHHNQHQHQHHNQHPSHPHHQHRPRTSSMVLEQTPPPPPPPGPPNPMSVLERKKRLLACIDGPTNDGDTQSLGSGSGTSSGGGSNSGVNNNSFRSLPSQTNPSSAPSMSQSHHRDHHHHTSSNHLQQQQQQQQMHHHPSHHHTHHHGLPPSSNNVATSVSATTMPPSSPYGHKTATNSPSHHHQNHHHHHHHHSNTSNHHRSPSLSSSSHVPNSKPSISSSSYSPSMQANNLAHDDTTLLMTNKHISNGTNDLKRNNSLPPGKTATPPAPTTPLSTTSTTGLGGSSSGGGSINRDGGGNSGVGGLVTSKREQASSIPVCSGSSSPFSSSTMHRSSSGINIISKTQTATTISTLTSGPQITTLAGLSDKPKKTSSSLLPNSIYNKAGPGQKSSTLSTYTQILHKGDDSKMIDIGSQSINTKVQDPRLVKINLALTTTNPEDSIIFTRIPSSVDDQLNLDSIKVTSSELSKLKNPTTSLADSTTHKIDDQGSSEVSSSSDADLSKALTSRLSSAPKKPVMNLPLPKFACTVSQNHQVSETTSSKKPTPDRELTTVSSSNKLLLNKTPLISLSRQHLSPSSLASFSSPQPTATVTPMVDYSKFNIRKRTPPSSTLSSSSLEHTNSIATSISATLPSTSSDEEKASPNLIEPATSHHSDDIEEQRPIVETITRIDAVKVDPDEPKKVVVEKKKQQQEPKVAKQETSASTTKSKATVKPDRVTNQVAPKKQTPPPKEKDVSIEIKSENKIKKKETSVCASPDDTAKRKLEEKKSRRKFETKLKERLQAKNKEKFRVRAKKRRVDEKPSSKIKSTTKRGIKNVTKKKGGIKSREKPKTKRRKPSLFSIDDDDNSNIYLSMYDKVKARSIANQSHSTTPPITNTISASKKKDPPKRTKKQVTKPSTSRRKDDTDSSTDSGSDSDDSKSEKVVDEEKQERPKSPVKTKFAAQPKASVTKKRLDVKDFELHTTATQSSSTSSSLSTSSSSSSSSSSSASSSSSSSSSSEDEEDEDAELNEIVANTAERIGNEISVIEEANSPQLSPPPSPIAMDGSFLMSPAESQKPNIEDLIAPSSESWSSLVSQPLHISLPQISQRSTPNTPSPRKTASTDIIAMSSPAISAKTLTPECSPREKAPSIPAEAPTIDSRCETEQAISTLLMEMDDFEFEKPAPEIAPTEAPKAEDVPESEDFEAKEQLERLNEIEMGSSSEPEMKADIIEPDPEPITKLDTSEEQIENKEVAIPEKEDLPEEEVCVEMVTEDQAPETSDIETIGTKTIDEPTIEIPTEPSIEPIVVPEVEETPQPITQLVEEAVAEPIVDHIAEKTVEQVVEPMIVPVVVPVKESLVEPVVKQAAEDTQSTKRLRKVTETDDNKSASEESPTKSSCFDVFEFRDSDDEDNTTKSAKRSPSAPAVTNTDTETKMDMTPEPTTIDLSQPKQDREYITELNQDGKLSLTIRKASQAREVAQDLRQPAPKAPILNNTTPSSGPPPPAPEIEPAPQTSTSDIAQPSSEQLAQAKSAPPAPSSSSSTPNVKPTRRSARLMQTKEKKEPGAIEEHPKEATVNQPQPTVKPHQPAKDSNTPINLLENQPPSAAPAAKETTMQANPAEALKESQPSATADYIEPPPVKTRRTNNRGGKKATVKQQLTAQQSQAPPVPPQPPVAQPQPYQQQQILPQQSVIQPAPCVQQLTTQPQQQQQLLQQQQQPPPKPVPSSAEQTSQSGLTNIVRPKRLTRLAAKTYGINEAPPSQSNDNSLEATNITNDENSSVQAPPAPIPAREPTPVVEPAPIVEVSKPIPFFIPSYLPPRKRLGWFWSQKQLLEQRYLVVWTSRFTLKDAFAAVQMHFISGNNKMPSWSYRAMLDETGMPLPIVINQRMRLEPDELEGVQRKMSIEEDHCVLLAVPVGRDQSEYLKQSTSLRIGFIDYLIGKQAAGIVYVCQPGETQPSYIIHIFPSCTFVTDHILRCEPDLLNVIHNIDNLIVVITTA